MGAKEMTIGELASAAEVPSTTLRFYERKKLLVPVTRSDAGYRLYDKTSLERVKFIRAAQTIGLQVKDVQQLLDIADGKACACSEVRSLLDRRLKEIRQKVMELKKLESTVSKAMKVCKTTPDGQT